jgi:hypothetical protein
MEPKDSYGGSLATASADYYYFGDQEGTGGDRNKNTRKPANCVEKIPPMVEAPKKANEIPSTESEEGTSSATKTQVGWGLTTATVKKGFNFVNNEWIRQTHINNSLRKPGVPLDEVIPLKVPKSLRALGKYGGLAFSVWGAVDINSQYINNEISTYRMTVEQTSNGIGAVPAIGTAWTIGWELGRAITNIPGYNENVRLPVQRFLGIIPPEPKCRICP